MKQHEKDAQRLWARYLLGKTNEDTFWQKYEALLEQQERKKGGFEPILAQPPLRTNRSVYEASSEHLIYRVLVANLVIVLIYVFYNFKEQSPIYQLLLLVGFIAPWISFMRKHYTFTLDDHGLEVGKIGMLSHTIPWDEVKKIEFIRLKGSYHLKVITQQTVFIFRTSMSIDIREKSRRAIDFYLITTS
jgi:hypothetical protein